MAIFGEEHVDKLIMVSTPNNGVTGNVKSFCGIIGGDQECEDLAQGSIFLRKLNSPQNIPNEVEMYTIAAVGCDERDFDGIVELVSVQLPYAENHIINGTCTDLFGTDLHSNILDPDKYPETYNLILDILK
jgi:hypothetical protein